MADHTQKLLTADELDTIGEIMNISMGSAATAVSMMLEKQVTITTPCLEQNEFGNIDNSGLNPALIIKIGYVQGITGTNVMMFRRRDIQIILDLLMGNEVSDESDDFEFDEMSMSAASEVMNQMMGASATALSEILERTINISTPEALLVEEGDGEGNLSFFGIGEEESIIAISFKMMIKDVLDSTFTCFLSAELAEEMIGYVRNGMEEEASAPIETPAEPAPAAPFMPAPSDPAPMQNAAPFHENFGTLPPPSDPAPALHDPTYGGNYGNVPPPAEAFAPPPLPSEQPNMHNPMQAQMPYQQQPAVGMARAPMQFGVTPQQPYAQQGMPPYQQQQGGYPPYPPQGQQMGGYPPMNQQIQNADFPDFSNQSFYANAPSGSNLGLLMGVQLEVSVVVGRTKRKIKDVMEFGQGSVIELDKQMGAPAEIMVNGQLLAYGDVIVVGDNFGIRITEIVGTKELLNSLDSNM